MYSILGLKRWWNWYPGPNWSDLLVFVFVSFVSLASLTRKGWMVELAAWAQFVSPLPSSPKSLPRVELSYYHRLFLHLKL